ncbi:MAG: hypothetical protein WAS93_02275 [Burkholderiaceae bacterium]
MSTSHHLTQPLARRERQSGVALLTVLILLVVLAAASVALIQSQRGAVRQMADRLEVLDQTAASAMAHDACVARMRAGMESAAPLTDALAGFEGKTAFARTSDSRWGSDNCLFEWYQLPKNSVDAWTPYIRVTSRVLVNGQMLLEVSEWRYPACPTGQVCAMRSVKSLQDDGQLKTLLNVQYGSGSISTARQRL